MRFLIIRTDIRAVADGDLAAAWAGGGSPRNEETSPEHRRQVVRAEDRDAALLLARALSTVGAVRSGRQRIKVLSVGRPEPRPTPLPAARPASLDQPAILAPRAAPRPG